MNNDLLRTLRLVVLLLDRVADQRAAYRADHHRHLAPGSATDQAAAAEPTDGRADTAVMVALDLDRGDLCDHALADFTSPGDRAIRGKANPLTSSAAASVRNVRCMMERCALGRMLPTTHRGIRQTTRRFPPDGWEPVLQSAA